MPIVYTNHGYPMKEGRITHEERLLFRKMKHRWHARRSRRLRGVDNVDRSEPGVRVPYEGTPCTCCDGSLDVYPRACQPVVDDYNGDGIPDGTPV